MNKPLLSVAIATKNREKYCIEAIQSILNYNDERIEITVADNSATTLVKEFVEKINSPQIKYLYDNSEISSIDNFNRCLDMTSGEYLIMIGDDDTVLPSAIAIAQWAKENNIESIVSSHPVTYIWPNDKIKKFEEGNLSFPNYDSEIRSVVAKEELLKLVKSGFIAYQSYDLPRLYHGIIKRSCMEEIKRHTGYFFQGLTPDIYSTVALGSIVKEHYIINYPISIAGACPSSTTVEATIGGHSGKLESAPHLKNRPEYIWESIIPRYYSVETIWAESAIKALKDIGEVELLKHFNNFKLYVYGIHFNKKYIKKLSIDETNKLASTLKMSSLEFKYKMTNQYFIIAFSVIKKRLLSKKIKAGETINKEFLKVYTIQHAIDLVNSNTINLILNKGK